MLIIIGCGVLIWLYVLSPRTKSNIVQSLRLRRKPGEEESLERSKSTDIDVKADSNGSDEIFELQSDSKVDYLPELSAKGQVYEMDGCTVQEKRLAAAEMNADNESRYGEDCEKGISNKAFD